MSAAALYPLTLAPVYKDYIWGGARIAARFGRPDAPPRCAESWEVADRPEGMSRVLNGPAAGQTLGDLVTAMGAGLVGRAAPRTDRFPLLIKVIDARETLSVQVHPDDAAAAAHGGEAKTEMWYMLDSDPGAGIFAGLHGGATPAALLEAIRFNSLESLLEWQPAHGGQAVYIRGGCLHAIGEGCLILEVQQSSNTTYRVYDWGRVDPDGRPRPLHVEQALQVIDWNEPPPPAQAPRFARLQGANTWWDVVRSPYFDILRAELHEPAQLDHDGTTFTAIFVESGELGVHGGGVGEVLGAGASCLLPAALPACTLSPRPRASVILTQLGSR